MSRPSMVTMEKNKTSSANSEKMLRLSTGIISTMSHGFKTNVKSRTNSPTYQLLLVKNFFHCCISRHLENIKKSYVILRKKRAMRSSNPDIKTLLRERSDGRFKMKKLTFNTTQNSGKVMKIYCRSKKTGQGLFDQRVIIYYRSKIGLYILTFVR